VKRVLVVDDHEENLYLLQVLLQSQGYQVELARNGAEALEKARQDPPNLVVSDILMPVMDGFTLCRAWKTHEILRSVPFIFYTATYTDPRDEQLALSLGADAFITKPSEPQVFLDAVLAVLSRAEAGELVSAGLSDGHGEESILRQYNEALVRKLEKKMLELERANQELQREIDARRSAEESLRRQLALDELVRDLLAQTVSAKATELDALIDSAVERIATFMEVDSAIVFQAAGDLETWGATHSWAAPGIDSVADTLKEVPMGTLPWLEGEIREGRTVCLTSVDDLPARAADLRALWERQNLRSALMVPLRGRGSIVRGCLGLFVVRKRPCYGPEDIRRGEQLVEAVSSALERGLMEESLRARDEQLRQSQKMEAIGQLAGGIAHDFNNLLTAILGYSDLITADESVGIEQDGMAYVREIRKAAQRAAELTRQILAFSRRQTLRPEVVSLNESVDEVRPLLERTLGENVVLKFVLDPELGRCEVDPHQLLSVLMNLALNARDAMPRGGVLTIETANVELEDGYCDRHAECRPGSYVMLAVADTGVGMDKETQAHIFEPFFTTKDPSHGTGLGLSTVHGIVKQSGGHIFLYSEPGKGSVFKIYFPRTYKEVRPQVPSPVTVRRSVGGETILVVEDDELLANLIKRALTAAGYKVLFASRGEEALALVAGDQHMDLLLTDLILPGEIQGGLVIEKARESRPGLPVLCMSGYSRDFAEQMQMVEGITSHLDKPFTINALTAKVREVIDAGEEL
jgi:signal transduction histidine kinase/DNA-binding response OmpR family regulator